MPITPDVLKKTLSETPWQIGVPLPCRANTTVTEAGTFQVRIGVGIFPGVIVDETYSGRPEAWIAMGPDGERIWTAAVPSEMDKSHV